MSYEKHTWETGEVITAEKLNNIENGVEDTDKKVFIVYFYWDEDVIRFLEDFEDIENILNLENPPLVVGSFDGGILPIFVNGDGGLGFLSYDVTPEENKFYVSKLSISSDAPHLVTQHQYHGDISLDF